MKKTFTAMWSEDLGREIKKRSKADFKMKLRGADAELLTDVWNQGIDSHLEAFTQSTANWESNVLSVNIAFNEMHILIRRLLEFESEQNNEIELAASICSYLNIELI
jgi:hypothetical protein